MQQIPCRLGTGHPAYRECSKSQHSLQYGAPPLRTGPDAVNFVGTRRDYAAPIQLTVAYGTTSPSMSCQSCIYRLLPSSLAQVRRLLPSSLAQVRRLLPSSLAQVCRLLPFSLAQCVPFPPQPD
ncbi:unnamed protein product, partial [Staurois parvus]